MICFMLLLPSAGSMSELKANNKDINESQITDDDELPDLIVEDIIYYPHDPGSIDYYIEADVKNQGNTTAHGEVTIELKITRLLFRVIPIKVYYHKIDSYKLHDGLEPGETQTKLLTVGYLIPGLFGFYKIYVGINLDKKIDESDYNNNERTEKILVIFNVWLTLPL